MAAYSTFNAGASWSGTLLPKGSYDRAVDPSVAFDRQGTAWFAHLCLDLLPENHPANGIFVNRSTDGGTTWLAQPYVVTENGDPEGSEGTTIRDDRPGIACDRVPNSPFVNSVYVAWTQGSSDSTDNQVFFSWHDQELLEFSTPVKISDSPTGLAEAPAVAVGAGGRVLVAWYDRNVQKILLDVSTDGGRTFGEDRVLASNVADGVVVWGARALTYPSMATDALGGRYNGNVYVAWHENRSGHNRVMFRRSTNNGDSWGEAFPLEEDLTSYLLVAWYDASSETVRGRVMDPEGALGIDTVLLTHPVSAISLTPTAEDDRWGLASSDGSSVRWREFRAPEATGSTEETVAWGSEDLQQRYPSVAFGLGPSIDPGVAWEEYGWEINRRVVKYRERRGEYWQPVVVFTDNTSHPDYHSPSMTANEFTDTVAVAWRSGAEELRSVGRDWRGEWSEQTVLPVTGSDPALSLGRHPTSGDRELLAYRGISQLYAISATPVQPLGGGDEESPTSGTEGYQREGRGVSVVFPSGSLRLALVDAAFNGRRVGFARFPDTVEVRTAERVETTLFSEPLTGTGVLECTLLSQTTGEVPPGGEIRLVLRDGGIVTTILRSFRSGADSVQRVRIPLSLGTKVRRIGVQFSGSGTARTVEPERWIVGGSGGNANLAQKTLLRPEEVPAEFRLHPSYPNPFNPSTEIRFELPEPARVSLVIYDVLGRVVETLIDETNEAGYHSVRWNASGRSSGVYLARFTATTATGSTALQRTMKLVLAK